MGTPLAAPVKSGPDVDTFKRVTAEFGKVQAARTQAGDVITSLRTAANNLKVSIESIEKELVTGQEKPVGALPDQNVLNKASEDLTKEAETLATKSAVTLPTVKGDVVKEQTPALQSLTDLQKAVNDAVTAAETAKTAPTEPNKTAETKAKAEVTAKLEAAKSAMTTAQTALTTAATSKESPIRTPSIRGAALP